MTEQPNLIGNLYIYPNPASYQITVETPAELVNARLNIYNQLGEVVYTDVLNGKKVTLSTEYLKSGIYFVYISDGQHIYTQKLILE
ncbi:MAG: T9SS type A sorting domain-containing protein [Bacteroidetes bacterium]|nr:T9SS type A sorting domain-containing protein [Bacteroidota bacterium]